jgi:hypothetical protein
MVLFRSMVLLALLTALVCFMFYAGTGQLRFRRYGWMVLKGALMAAFGFFAVLILDRMA